MRGFTIVELLIVIVIIGILAAIVIVAYNGVTNRAKASKAKAAATQVLKKAEAYNAEIGSYPSTHALMTGATSTLSYYLTGVTPSNANIAAAPANESTIEIASCTGGGYRVQYWDYSKATPAIGTDVNYGGATTSSVCTGYFTS
jgi:prepilin-type N-terminal cleavage/methylation domain-containing protein